MFFFFFFSSLTSVCFWHCSTYKGTKKMKLFDYFCCIGFAKCKNCTVNNHALLVYVRNGEKNWQKICIVILSLAILMNKNYYSIHHDFSSMILKNLGMEGKEKKNWLQCFSVLSLILIWLWRILAWRGEKIFSNASDFFPPQQFWFNSE